MDPITENEIERELLSRLRSGDEKAFEQFYKNYGRRIFGNILKMVKDQEIAQELLQDVFVKVWENRSVIDIDRSFKSYLFTISRNLVYNHLKRISLERQIEAYLSSNRSELYSHIEEDLFFEETEQAFKKAVADLPPKRQQIFIMCKIEGKSYEEVSALQDVSVSTINDHVVKGVRFVKEHMERSRLIILTGLISTTVALHGYCKYLIA